MASASRQIRLRFGCGMVTQGARRPVVPLWYAPWDAVSRAASLSRHPRTFDGAPETTDGGVPDGTGGPAGRVFPDAVGRAVGQRL